MTEIAIAVAVYLVAGILISSSVARSRKLGRGAKWANRLVIIRAIRLGKKQLREKKSR